jgi:hypothetical protein
LLVFRFRHPYPPSIYTCDHPQIHYANVVFRDRPNTPLKVNPDQQIQNAARTTPVISNAISRTFVAGGLRFSG